MRFPHVVALSLVLGAVSAVSVAQPAKKPAPESSPTATLLAKPPVMPDMAIGKDKAPITIIEYSSLTCPHCAAFEENVLPMLRTKYIDTGKVRFISREFPLDIKAAAASMLARCVAADNSSRYFDARALLFQQQQAVVEHTVDTLKDIGGHFGMSEQQVDGCEKDQKLLENIVADQKFAFDQLKVDATPSFFINGEMSKGSMAFEDLDKRLTKLLKR